MQHPTVSLPFSAPIAPQLAFAVLHLEDALEQGVVDELSVSLEAAVGVMRRVVAGNGINDRALTVESWPWEQAQELVESVEAARSAAGEGSAVAQALDVALRFFVNFLAELQEQQTGERHVLCVA